MSNVDEQIKKALEEKYASRGQMDDKTSGRFVRSLDGDTIDIAVGNLRYPVRFDGIDSPESSQKLGQDAHQYLNSLIDQNGPIKVRRGPNDRHGRMTGQIYSGDKNLNVEMVRAGYAKVYRDYLKVVPEDVKKQLLEAEEQAKTSGIGIWGKDAGDTDYAAYRRDNKDAYKKGHYGKLPEGAPDTLDNLIADALRKKYAARGQRIEKIGHPAYSRTRFEGAYPQEEGLMDTAMNALDYAGNISRSAILGLSQDGLGRAWDYGVEAANKRRYTDPTALKDELFGKHRAGIDNDGEVQFGDILDFAADMVVDVATDPLTWMTGGLSYAAKTAKGAKYLSTAAKATKLKHPGKAAMGAWYGQSMSDPDASAYERVRNAALGAGAVMAVGKAAPRVTKYSKMLMDKAADSYYLKSRGYENFTHYKYLADEAFKKIEFYKTFIMQGRLGALDGLSEAEKLTVSKMLGKMKTEFIRRRNSYIKKQINLKDYDPMNWIAQYEAGTLKSTKVSYRGNRMPNAEAYDHIKMELRRIDEDITRTMTKGTTKKSSYEARKLKQMMDEVADESKDRVATAFYKMIKHNEEVVKKLNMERFGLENGIPKRDRGIFGIRWHIDDVYKKDFKESLDELDDVFKENTIHRAKSQNRTDLQRKQMGSDKTYEIYANQFATRFLEPKFQEAIQEMRKLSEIDPVGKFATFEKVLKRYDGMTNLMKANMLFFSQSWLKNNYFDNLTKAYLETGVMGAAETARAGFFMKGMKDDILSIYSKDRSKLYRSPDVLKAIELGVLDNPLFKAMTDDDTIKFMFSPEQAALKRIKESPALLTEAAENDLHLKTFRELAQAGMNPNKAAIESTKMIQKHLKGYVRKSSDSKLMAGVKAADAIRGKAVEKWMRKIGPDTVGRIGSYIEGTARMSTFLRTKKILMKGGMNEEAAYKQAAEVVSKTFFDYDNVTHFENAVMKRFFIPFYSFYLKNLPYWAEAVVDPMRAGRLNLAEKLRRNTGDNPLGYQLAGMDDYIAENNPRVVGVDRQGNRVVSLYPSSSFHDAIMMMNWETISDQFIEKFHPGWKTLAEISLDKDLFTGGKLLASSQDNARKGEDDRKYMFSRGFKIAAVAWALNKLGVDKKDAEYIASVDDKGNPVTSSDAVVILDKLASTFFPHGFVDQVAGAAGKNIYGKENLTEMFSNLMLPIRTIKISPEYQRMVRKMRRRHYGSSSED